jgi:hypothetical protein
VETPTTETPSTTDAAPNVDPVVGTAATAGTPSQQDSKQEHANETAPRPLPASPSSPQTATEQPSGEHFMVWLKQGIQSRKLIINDAKALVHTVADSVLLVSPGVFQRYVQEHPQIAAYAKEDRVQEWRWVQKRFEKLQLHLMLLEQIQAISPVLHHHPALLDVLGMIVGGADTVGVGVRELGVHPDLWIAQFVERRRDGSALAFLPRKHLTLLE